MILLEYVEENFSAQETSV